MDKGLLHESTVPAKYPGTVQVNVFIQIMTCEGLTYSVTEKREEYKLC
jgi:hypothetical protein